MRCNPEYERKYELYPIGERLPSDYWLLREVLNHPGTNCVQHAKHSVTVVHNGGRELDWYSIY